MQFNIETPVKLPSPSQALSADRHHHHHSNHRHRQPQQDAQSPPFWVTGLTTATLFNPCAHHPGAHKNECNIFCFTCTPATGQAMCRHCLPYHDCGNATCSFQIRRYMYQNVVHSEDINSYYDISGVQTYCINARRAVLVKPKPPPATAAAAPAFQHQCRGCRVPLRPDCEFCSFKCKVDVDYGMEAEPVTPWLAADGGRGPAKTVGGGGGGGGTSFCGVGGVIGGGAGRAASTGLLGVETADLSEGYHHHHRMGRMASEAPTLTTFTGCKRRKLGRPLRSHLF